MLTLVYHLADNLEQDWYNCEQNCLTQSGFEITSQPSSNHYTLFFYAVRCMMFGFGDDQCPYTESVDFLEDLVIEYITEIVNTIGLFLID
jgi:hypothetical protein